MDFFNPSPGVLCLQEGEVNGDLDSEDEEDEDDDDDGQSPLITSLIIIVDSSSEDGNVKLQHCSLSTGSGKIHTIYFSGNK